MTKKQALTLSNGFCSDACYRQDRAVKYKSDNGKTIVAYCYPDGWYLQIGFRLVKADERDVSILDSIEAL